MIERETAPLRRTFVTNTAEKMPKSGTTLVGFTYENGEKVLMAADRMTSDGWHVFSMISEKLYGVGSNVVVSGTGLVGMIQRLIECFQHLTDIMGYEIGEELSAEGKANLFHNILRATAWPMEAQFVLGGYDPDAKAFVKNFDCAGGVYEAKYFCDGCGKPYAESILDSDKGWSPDLNRAEAIKLAVRALIQAGKRSAFSAHPFLSPVRIALIGEKGIEWVAETEIKKAIRKFCPSYFSRQKASEPAKGGAA
jgi:20S proteasome alpha/beta subunit